MILGREAALFKKLIAQKFIVHCVFAAQTKAVRQARAFYQGIEVYVSSATSAKIPATHYHNVIGDTVIEVTLPKSLADAIENECKHPRAPTAEAAHRLAHRAADISIGVQKNSTLTRALLEMVRC